MGSDIRAVQKLDLVRSSASITRPANATPYTAGDAVSDTTGNALHTFTRCLRDGRLGGEIRAAHIVSSGGGLSTGLDGELYLFHTTIGLTADNAAWAPTDAEQLTCVGMIKFLTADWRFTANNGRCLALPNLPFLGLPDATNGGVKLFGQLVARNAYVPVSGEVLTIELIVAQY